MDILSILSDCGNFHGVHCVLAAAKIILWELFYFNMKYTPAFLEKAARSSKCSEQV